MNDTMTTAAAHHASAPAARAGGVGAQAGRATAPGLARLLNAVDYGMLLVAEDGCVLFVNQSARLDMDDGHPLQLLGGELRARHPGDVVRLHSALAGAMHRGVQALITLGTPTSRAIDVAVLPQPDASERTAALILGRRRASEELSTEAYARRHKLTLAETRVLRHLCRGERPQDIAHTLGVKLSTVRSQIGSIRTKTGHREISAIVQCVARLPPLPCLTGRTAPAE
jgi:DNA-binding CsgD family transcriptional regulator